MLWFVPIFYMYCNCFPNTPIVHCIYQNIYVTCSDKPKAMKTSDYMKCLFFPLLSVSNPFFFSQDTKMSEFRAHLFIQTCTHTRIGNVSLHGADIAIISGAITDSQQQSHENSRCEVAAAVMEQKGQTKKKTPTTDHLKRGWEHMRIMLGLTEASKLNT